MNTYFIAFILVFTAAALLCLFLLYRTDLSKRRMRRMLRRQGLSPRILEEHGHEAVKKLVRHRCAKCQSEDVCERWLTGELKGANDFCPNAQIFEQIKQLREN